MKKLYPTWFSRLRPVEGNKITDGMYWAVQSRGHNTEVYRLLPYADADTYTVSTSPAHVRIVCAIIETCIVMEKHTNTPPWYAFQSDPIPHMYRNLGPMYICTLPPEISFKEIPPSWVGLLCGPSKKEGTEPESAKNQEHPLP